MLQKTNSHERLSVMVTRRQISCRQAMWHVRQIEQAIMVLALTSNRSSRPGLMPPSFMPLMRMEFPAMWIAKNRQARYVAVYSPSASSSRVSLAARTAGLLKMVDSDRQARSLLT